MQPISHFARYMSKEFSWHSQDGEALQALSNNSASGVCRRRPYRDNTFRAFSES
jgi:hypothetical protein